MIFTSLHEPPGDCILVVSASPIIHVHVRCVCNTEYGGFWISES